jgi:tetratricopeptide (TPR) repeat protein
MPEILTDPAALVPGTASLARGDYAAAIQACNEALASNPRRGDVYYNRARAHRALGHLDDAIADVMAAIRLDPTHAEAHRILGELHLLQGNVKVAIACCDEAILLDPSLAPAYNTRAGARLLRNELQEALADCNQAIRLAPKLWEVYTTRGSVRYHLGDPNASDDFRTSFRINTEGYVRGLVQALAGQVRQRARYVFVTCEAHLRANPRDASSYVRRGLSLVLLGKDDEAQRDLDQALRVDPLLSERLPLLVAEAKRVRGSTPVSET